MIRTDGTQAVRLARVVRAAISAGLITAFLHVAILEVRLHAFGRLVFSWPDFVWMAPLSYVLYFLLLAIPLWGLSRWSGRVRGEHVFGTYAAMGAFSLLILFRRIHPLAFAVLAAGVGVVAARLLRRFPRPMRRGVVWASVGSAVGLMALTGARTLWPALAERRALAAEREAAVDAPNVLLLILDTVRAANLGAYGYERPTSPALDALAREGLTFDHAFAVESWTLPSHASILTGMWAAETGTSYLTPLRRDLSTLPEVLRQRGYRTGAFVANGGWAGPGSGLGRGFLRFESYEIRAATFLHTPSFGQMHLAHELIGGVVALDAKRLGRALAEFELRTLEPRRPRGLTADDVAQRFLAWRSRVGDRHPWFAMLNFLDAHWPYDSPRGFHDRFNGGREPIDRYDGSIAYIDSVVGGLIRALRARGELDRTVVIVTADHGELFGEHGRQGHGTTLYLPVVHVPLILRFPPRVEASTRRDDAVPLRDLAATILDLAGVGGADALPGRSLLQGERPAEPILLRASRGINVDPDQPNAAGDIVGVVTDEWHYIRYSGGTEELFAWRRDPSERQNLAGSREFEPALRALRPLVPPIR